MQPLFYIEILCFLSNFSPILFVVFTLIVFLSPQKRKHAHPGNPMTPPGGRADLHVRTFNFARFHLPSAASG
ncbi:hypothetical protein OBV_07680 [Oscillibacter valericigenes Sjm18-20]|nr:hypothetical protein OBV_07680 [Oscillibacter valericigenes Sjm18-20]